MSEDIFELWTYLSARPLTGLTVTLLAYAAAEALHHRLGRSPLLSPVLVAIALVGGLLHLTRTPYARYFDGAQFVHFLLGPATVALAVPLHRNLQRVRAAAAGIGAGLLAGSVVAAGSAVGIAWSVGAAPDVLRTVAPKSATTPVAAAIAERIGGLPSLTAVLVILTGIVGAVIGGPLLDRLGVKDPRARGLAYGVTAHGLGTARAFSEGQTAGAFASLGMGLNALATAIVVPAVAALLDPG